MNKELDSECIAALEWIKGRYRIPHAIALRVLSDLHYQAGSLPGDKELDRAKDQRFVDHIRGCDVCTAWIRRTVGEKIWNRQERLLSYCCTAMFAAVEKPKTNAVRLRHVAGEPCWSVDGKNTFMRYCPWCGTEMPGSNFIDSRTSE